MPTNAVGRTPLTPPPAPTTTAMAATKRTSLMPATSRDPGSITMAGPISTRSFASAAPVERATPPPPKTATTSPANAATPHACSAWPANTGASKYARTGSSTSPSTKTAAELAKTTPSITSSPSADSSSTSYGETPKPSIAASKDDDAPPATAWKGCASS